MHYIDCVKCLAVWDVYPLFPPSIFIPLCLLPLSPFTHLNLFLPSEQATCSNGPCSYNAIPVEKTDLCVERIIFSMCSWPWQNLFFFPLLALEYLFVCFHTIQIAAPMYGIL